MTRAWPALVVALCAGCIFTSRPMPPPDNADDAGGTSFSDVAAGADTTVPRADVEAPFDAPVYDVPKPPFDASASDVATASDASGSDASPPSDVTASDASPPSDVTAADATDGARCDAGDAGDGATCDVTLVDGGSPTVDAAADAGVDGGETGGGL